jgi:beta-1,4-mannooligosaccharide/beta-1,4-mannosyl-N-acetylglucosamine phosphorylase
MPTKHVKLQRNVVQRYHRNPIISLGDLPFHASDIHNAGAVLHKGRYVLLITIENLQGYCSIYRAHSDDGRRIDPDPVLAPAEKGAFAQYEAEGVRDARITHYDGTYYIVYLAQSEHGFRLALARTKDFSSIERVALISEPDTKNGALFPRKIGGRFARLERPREGGNIWISHSEDLLNWGDWDVVMTPRGGYWDQDRIGLSVPPILTPCGWLVFYYGVRNMPSGPLFRLGAAFLNEEDPREVVGRSNIPLLAPSETYERIGDVQNLVFSCGAITNTKTGKVELYYGASDSCICLGTVGLDILEDLCRAQPKEED